MCLDNGDNILTDLDNLITQFDNSYRLTQHQAESAALNYLNMADSNPIKQQQLIAIKELASEARAWLSAKQELQTLYLKIKSR